MAVLTDSSLMPSGAHAGKAMKDVPVEYLLWMYQNKKCSGNVQAYIKENLDTLIEKVNVNIKKHQRKNNYHSNK